MLGFLSPSCDLTKKLKKEQIYFVSVPDSIEESELKVIFSQLAKSFADELNINRVYLYTGKDFILYEYEV